ncbi:MAG: SCO family protein [Roseiflexus sp.]|nr:SCO family protein [Roseiflexus sp.]MCS7290399.1 SCO family protein [Roseiflexus sp.]MDW8232769.1 SCO family protein [Roseiflexaceae bacterium]
MHSSSPRVSATPLQRSARPVEGSQSASVRWIKRALYGVTALFTTLVALILWFVIARPIQVLPRIGPAPAFMLTDQDGRWVSDIDLRGSLLLINFAHTRCGERCATMERGLLTVADSLRANGRLGTQVRLVTITVDADHDTPAVLRTYAARLNVAAPEWIFLTGSARELKQLIGGEYGVYYRVNGETIDLDQRVVLVDETGLLRAEYDGTRLDPAIILRDIGLVEQEANSSDAARPIYEAAHLFVCYPR